MTRVPKLTVKEHSDQVHDHPAEGVGAIERGIVKWLVDVYDETGETVAVATILTMVRKRQG